jgi:outer membrane immunogenic protein
MAIVFAAPASAQTLRVTGANSATASGFTGGAQAGYSWQNGPLVYGFETDFSAVRLNGVTNDRPSCTGFVCQFLVPPPAATTSSSIDWYGTVRGRLGFAAGPALVYATGGLAYGKVDLSSSFDVAGLSVISQTSSTKTGWVAGGGIEYLIQPNLALNLGYQYVDLGTVSLPSLPTNTACCTGYLMQDAKYHAQFQAVTLGLSWKFGPAATAGALKPWEGGYLGAHAGGAWGTDMLAHFFGYFFSCFTATTPVLMADGTSRPIATVKVGDEVMGEDGAVNRVVAIETPALGSRGLYAFNGGPAFVTPEHPFMTRDGWKSMAPDATFAENNSFRAGKLKTGDELVQVQSLETRDRPVSVVLGGAMKAPGADVLVETRFSRLESATRHDGDPFMTVYNLRLDGNHTYFANNYLVHNK